MRKKKRKCIVCGDRATKRMRFPMKMYLCDDCGEMLEAELAFNGLRVVVTPPFGQIGLQSMILKTWVAGSKAEYDRAVELGIVGGWDSYDAYEAHVKKFIRTCPGSVILIEITPNEIIEKLAELGLENTPEGRTELYQSLY